jgi:SAM-dependent methyltransferase
MTSLFRLNLLKRSFSSIPCSICDSPQTCRFLVWNGMDIHKCPLCHVLFVVGAPSQEKLVRMYNTQELPQERLDSNSAREGEPPAWKMREQSRLLDFIEKWGSGGGTLLDVGCFSGLFLHNAKLRGFEVVGIDPTNDAVSFVRNVYKFEVIHGNLRSGRFAPDQFSVVSFLDVIEHLTDPISEMKESFRILRPGGLLVMTTPNARGLIQKVVQAKRWLFRQSWCPIDNVPWHLWGFTSHTLSVCAEKAGFVTKEVAWLEPSPCSSNLGAGSNPAKKLGLRIAAELCKLLGMSDRFVLIAQKPNAHGGKVDDEEGGGAH